MFISNNPALFHLWWKGNLLKHLKVPKYESGCNICATMAFPPFRRCDHVVPCWSNDFPINSKQDAPFHCIAYDYSHADWDGLCDNLRDVPCKNIFKLSASAAASEFFEWVQVGTGLYK